MIFISKLDDLVGKQIDFLFVKGRAPDKRRKNGKAVAHFWCDCACGTKDVLRSGDNLKVIGRMHSCGCLKRELEVEANTTHGQTAKGVDRRIYRIWSLMKDRCYNENNPRYKYYGGKGVIVCDEWHDFVSFREWALCNGYQRDLSIDRIDSDGNYCPENCRWATVEEQASNRSMCHYITIKGETHTLTYWSKKYHICRSAIRKRIAKGWSEEDAVTIPSRSIKSTLRKIEAMSAKQQPF